MGVAGEIGEDAWVFGASLRIVMSSIMRRRNGLMVLSVMGDGWVYIGALGGAIYDRA